MIPNRDGTPVDAVPFLVVVALAFLVIFSAGPIYVNALGLDFPAAISVSALVFLGTVAVAYHRFVWRATPPVDARVPPGERIRNLVYAALALALLLVLFTLPLL